VDAAGEQAHDGDGAERRRRDALPDGTAVPAQRGVGMTLVARNLDSPDEKRGFDNGEMNLVHIEGATIGRAVFRRGWKWSNDVKPIAGTDSCQAPHTGYVISGRMHVVMDDGTECEMGPGDAIVISPGHDAWVVGEADCVVLDWTGSVDYAKPSS
jgi:hypothetical protein